MIELLILNEFRFMEQYSWISEVNFGATRESGILRNYFVKVYGLGRCEIPRGIPDRALSVRTNFF